MTESHAESEQGRGVGALHLWAGHIAIRIADAFRPRLSLGVRLIALDDADGVFLVRHSYLPGLHFPGGAVDADESCREAAVREAREEGGLVLDAPPELFHVYHSAGGGRRDHVVVFVARGARQPQPMRPGLEIREAAFHPLDRLPPDVTDPTRRRIDEVLGGSPPDDVW
jgi:ADP-ribose pyrophosphatase YjhB (NUDIX family)